MVGFLPALSTGSGRDCLRFAVSGLLLLLAEPWQARSQRFLQKTAVASEGNMGFTWFYRFTLLVQKDFFKMGTFAIGN